MRVDTHNHSMEGGGQTSIALGPKVFDISKHHIALVRVKRSETLVLNGFHPERGCGLGNLCRSGEEGHGQQQHSG